MKSSPNSAEDKVRFRKNSARALAALAILILIHHFLSEGFSPGGFLKASLNWISSLGPLGPALFILLYILACLFFLPGTILSLGAGAVYGVVKGTALVSLSSILGATAAFLTGRYLARGWVEKRIQGNAKFKAIDEAVAKEGWKIVGLTRLSPAFPFSLLNYAYGVTKVSLRDYLFASWIGMMPGTVMYVYIGSLAGAAAEGAGAAQWTLRIVGLLATIFVTVYVTRIANKALKIETASSNKGI